MKGEPAESVGKFKYLGRVIRTNGNVCDNIIMKIGKTSVNFKKMKKVSQSTSISIR